MNKADIIKEVEETVGNSKDAKVLVESIITNITEALAKGEEVTLSGFGTFRVVKRASRKGINPQTGESLTIKAKKVPKFVPFKALKDAVN